MQATSKAYKSEQAEHLREKSYVWVYLGVINREAQRSAVVDSEVTYWSKPAFDSQDLEGVYATLEQNFFRADGSQLFPPRGAWAMYQGMASDDGSITMSFGRYEHLNIKGLTLKFYEDAYPVSLTITNGSARCTYTHEVTRDDFDLDGRWTCDDEFLDTAYIKLTANEMSGGGQRLRVTEMLFGVGFHFTNKDLISTSRKNTVSHLSNNLPSKGFNFVIDNTSKKFSADDPHSYIHFLQEQQEVEFDYGREMADGSIYVIKGGRTSLKTWSSDDQKATFTTVGFLDYMDTTYYKGQYSEEGRSYYELAEDVLADAGIEEYNLDTYLKKLTTHNPLPIEKHKNLLQLIANACMCVLYEDRKGVLTIAGSFQPEATGVTSNGAMPFSKLENILAENVATGEYGGYEKDFWHADGHQYFHPRGDSYIESAYVSSFISDEDGLFETNPTLSIEWERAWTFFGMVIRFADVSPLEFVVHLYADGSEFDSFTVEEETIDLATVVNYEFYDVEKLVFEFTKANPHQRIHMKSVRFGNITDYTVDYGDLYQKTPTASTSEFVKYVNCHYYEYAYGTDVEQLSTVEADAGENDTTFSAPCHGYSLAYEDGGGGTLELIESGAYYVKFTSSRQAKVVVRGKKFTVADTELTAQVREIGADKTSRNALLDNRQMAQRNLGWLQDFYKNDVEYSLQYRGEPAIDCDDLIYLENKYVVKNLIRVSSEQIDTSTGMNMSCKIGARRVSYTEPARVDYAIVDESEVE